ncbi:MAG: haloacid dehalogenase type II [Pseudomonadota bacterium]
MPIRACVFDAYGTLFDVAAAARACAAEPGRDAFARKWAEVAETWRLKQLQYTWLRAVTDTHTDFWQVTQDGLDYALEQHGLSDPGLRTRLLQLYFELAAFPEVPTMLSALKSAGYGLAILSNGEPKMLNAAATSAGIAGTLDAILTVESVGVFKPDPKVYALVTQHFGCTREDVVFVSSNGWDACAASQYGFYSIWVNRKGEPMDRLPEVPKAELRDLTGLPDLVAGLS